MSPAPAHVSPLRLERRELAGADPLAAFADALAGGEDAFYWERPADGFALAARGVAAAIETRGPDRFDDAAAQARALFARVEDARPADVPPEAGALLVGGFAFDAAGPRGAWWDGFPAARFVLPAESVVRIGARGWRLAIDPRPGVAPRAPRRDAEPPLAYTAAPDRPHADYCALVERALEAIHAGRFEKVVPARSLRVDAERPLPVTTLLAALRDANPSCTIFAVARAGAVFLGATPERLARQRGRDLTLAALAGSAPRGRNPEQDAALGRALVEDKKEQEEHAVVVRALRDALAPRCERLELPEAPRLRRVESIQHLETPIRARLREGAHVLEVAGALHPSPAVAGAPRDAALAWLAEHERLDRGWWAAPLGFVDTDGGGELAVALRSMLVRGGRARLYAGAGVVHGSAPERELRETRLKLRALLDPLLEV